MRKKDGKLHLCVNYRGLNAKTAGDAYPLPRIRESFDALVGSRYFTTLDLASGYHQIAMYPKDQHKIAFVTPFDFYEYTRMPFGFTTAPAMFQRLIDGVMSVFMFDFVLVYLDDILVFSKTFDEHLTQLDRIIIQSQRRDGVETENFEMPTSMTRSQLPRPHCFRTWSRL